MKLERRRSIPLYSGRAMTLNWRDSADHFLNVSTHSRRLGAWPLAFERNMGPTGAESVFLARSQGAAIHLSADGVSVSSSQGVVRMPSKAPIRRRASPA
jgi:hypothetical protein